MNEVDRYLSSVLLKYRVDEQYGEIAHEAFLPVIVDWAQGNLRSFSLSGSSAKGTGIKGCSDVDFFISLSELTSANLRDIYLSLFNALRSCSNVSVRQQNVSIGVVWNGLQIDFTPAKKQNRSSSDHSIYKSTKDSWTQTNVNKHITMVLLSDLANEIKLTKIWRENHGLEFPSIYLECFALEVLNGGSKSVGSNFENLLVEIESKIETKRIIDPANTNNVISDDMSIVQKKRLKRCAQESLRSRSWSEVVW